MSQREPKGTVRCHLSCKKIHLGLAKSSPYLLHHLVVKPPLPGTLPQHQQDFYSHIEIPRNMHCSQREEFALGLHKDLMRQLVLSTNVLSVSTNTWRSLRSGKKCFRAWCEMATASQTACRVATHDHSNWWGMHLSLSLCSDKELSAPGPETRTKVFSTCLRHASIATWTCMQFTLGENPLVLSHHCRGLMYSRLKYITLDAAAIRHNSFWNCLTVSDWSFFFSHSLDCCEDWLNPSREHLCLHRGQNPHQAKISGSLHWRKHTFLALSLAEPPSAIH